MVKPIMPHKQQPQQYPHPMPMPSTAAYHPPPSLDIPTAQELEPVEIETLLSKTSVTHVTVFQNRAEVTRHIPLDFAEPNRKYMIHLRGLSAHIADDASVRVTGHGDFTILSMSMYTSNDQKPLSEAEQRQADQARLDLNAGQPTHVIDTQQLKERLREIEHLRLREMELREKLCLLDDSYALVGNYSNSVLSGKPTTSDAAYLMELLKPDNALRIVDQCQEKRSQLLQQRIDVKRELGMCSKQLAELISLHDTQQEELEKAITIWKEKKAAAKGILEEFDKRPSVSRKDATIMLDVHALDRSSGSLNLTYVVNNAMWTPTYDLRCDLSSGQIQLQYHGQVSQSTDEEWKNVQLTLSTAQPAIGGHPPKLRPLFYGERRYRDLTPQVADIALQAERMSTSARPFASSAKKTSSSRASAPGLPPPPPSAHVAHASVSGSSTSLATTFKVEGHTTILNTRKQQRVTLATIELQCRMRYYCVPRLTQAAYLQAYCTNVSLFPLLPSKTVNVFVNSNLVTTTELGLVVPGESFSAFLGIDSGVRVTYSPAPQMDGVVKGIFYGSSKKQSLKTKCIVENLTRAAAVVVVVDSVPQSQHQHIKVRLLHPSPDSIITTEENYQTDDSLCGGGLLGGVDTKLKDHPEITRNKYTNNLVWTCLLDPRQQQELVLEYDIEYPQNMAVDTFTM